MYFVLHYYHKTEVAASPVNAVNVFAVGYRTAFCSSLWCPGVVLHSAVLPGLTSSQVPVDALLGHAVQTPHVLLAVPHPQPLPWLDIPTRTEINPLVVLESHQVLLVLLPGDHHVPYREKSD